ncbi:MAG: O-antigen ligase family protein [Chloroflexi bacterium]|nr:O-antigen ligase family protein [Chloroflexota bacterium]
MIRTIVGVCLWIIAVGLSGLGLWTGRQVLDRGVVYGDPGPPFLEHDVTAHAVNTQLELEPDDVSTAGTLDLVKDAGFGWIRQQVSWADIEPGHKGNFWDFERNRPTWARWDTIARLARDRNLRVIARLELPPAWSRPEGSYKSHPPVNVRDYADFAAAFASRYRDQIGYLQIWNEPNLAEEWGRRPVDPAAYVELLRAGYTGARQGNPKVRILTASLAQTLEPDDETAAGLDDLVYFDRMYLYGAAPFFDVAAANGYGLWTGPNDHQVGAWYTNLPRVTLIREVMVRHRDTAKPVWISEFGWNTQPVDWTGRPSPWGRVDEATQASHLRGGYARAAREWPWLGPMAVWLMRQPRAEIDDPTPFFALVREDWTTRPAYDALRASASTHVLGVGMWQETAPGVTYEGTWQVTDDPKASGGALRETPAPNAHVRLAFEGTRFEVVTSVGPSRGVAYVTIDGSYLLANERPRNRFGQATLDLGAAQPADAKRFLVASGLPDGRHEFELTVSGDAGTGSSAPGVAFDGVVVSRDRTSAAETVYILGLIASGFGFFWLSRAPVRHAVIDGIGFFRDDRALQRDPIGEVGSVVDSRARLGSSYERAVVGSPDATIETSTGAKPVGGPVDEIRVAPQAQRGKWFQRDWISDAVLAFPAILPLAPVAISTPVGRFSPVELGLLGLASLAFLRALLRPGHEDPYDETATGARIGFQFDGLVVASVALGVAGTIAAVSSAYPNPAWREWRQIIIEPVTWFLLARQVARRADAGRRLAIALIVGASAVSALAFGQWVLGIGLVDADGVERARALYPSPNNLALFIGRVAPLAVVLGLWPSPEGNPLVRLWLRASVVAIVAGVAVTYSRGAWLAVGITLLWIGREWLNWRKIELKPSRRVVIFFTVALAFAILVMSRSERLALVFVSGGTGLLRFSVWTGAVAMIRDQPWLGLGLDQFVYAYPRYMGADAWREPNLSHPHQFLLDFWIRLGVPGMLLLMYVGVRLIWRLRPGNRLRNLNPLAIGTTGAFIVWAIHGLVDNSFFVLDLAYATWALLLIHDLATANPPRYPGTGSIDNAQE